MKDRFGKDGDVISIDELMRIADEIDRDTAAFLGCTVEDLNTDTIAPYAQADIDFCVAANSSNIDDGDREIDDATEDEEDTMVCERHGVSLHIHECEGIDF